MNIRLSEPPFFSFQGEGRYTGNPTIFVRFMGCNLTCAGFGQDKPEDPTTYVVTHINPKEFKSLHDIPIPKYGCDSTYSVNAAYKHLSTDYTTAELVATINGLYPAGTDVSGSHIDLCFTGGEPMLRQPAMIALVESMLDTGVYPKRITIETNGTVPLSAEFKEFFSYCDSDFDIALCFNMSPKLLTVSGEENAVDYDTIEEYMWFGYTADLKFVMTNREEAWNELKQHVYILRATAAGAYSFNFKSQIYIMPEGASNEKQESADVEQIVKKALSNGFAISGRLHVYMLHNLIGT